MAKITFKENLIHTNGQLPPIDAPAPDFKLVDDELNDRTLADYAGKKKIIYMVPSLDTDVCSTSSKKLSEALKKRKDLVFIVVSADLPFAQKRFCLDSALDNIVTLSMMRSKDFAQDYGMLILTGPLSGLLARALVVLDEENKIVYRELVPEVTREPNYEKLLEFLG